jgi:hypothetical protein
MSFTLKMLPPEYTDTVSVTVFVPVEDTVRLEKTLTEATNAKISMTFGEEDFFDFN